MEGRHPDTAVEHVLTDVFDSGFRGAVFDLFLPLGRPQFFACEEGVSLNGVDLFHRNVLEIAACVE